MSLDKSIEHGKEHRKPYRGVKAVDRYKLIGKAMEALKNDPGAFEW